MHNDLTLDLNWAEIKVTDTHKYLGNHFDKKLSSILHTKYLKQKCYQYIQLLCIIANTNTY